MKVCVLGSGGWGTALSLVLLENGHDVALWSFTQEEYEAITADLMARIRALEVQTI